MEAVRRGRGGGISGVLKNIYMEVVMATTQADQIYFQIKKAMEEYDRDFEAALRRSDEIARDEMLHAQRNTQNWEILERFGTIL